MSLLVTSFGSGLGVEAVVAALTWRMANRHLAVAGYAGLGFLAFLATIVLASGS